MNSSSPHSDLRVTQNDCPKKTTVNKTDSKLSHDSMIYLWSQAEEQLSSSPGLEPCMSTLDGHQHPSPSPTHDLPKHLGEEKKKEKLKGHQMDSTQKEPK